MSIGEAIGGALISGVSNLIGGEETNATNQKLLPQIMLLRLSWRIQLISVKSLI